MMNNNNNKTYKGIGSKKDCLSLVPMWCPPAPWNYYQWRICHSWINATKSLLLKKVLLRTLFLLLRLLLVRSGKYTMLGVLWSYQHLQSATLMPFLQGQSSRISCSHTGRTYHDQQEKGGINATVSATRDATDEALLNNLEHWLEVFLGQGATAVEVKSGYGLSHDQEIRLLRIINRAKADKQHGVEVEVIPTYLGAHAVPRDAKSREDYIEEMIIKTLPMVKHENLARVCRRVCGVSSIQRGRG